MTQLDLFDVTYRRHKGNPESTAASRSMAAHKELQRSKVLDEIRRAGKFERTCDELEFMLGLSHQACSARCTELLGLCFVKRSGSKRNTRTGRPASVLIAND